MFFEQSEESFICFSAFFVAEEDFLLVMMMMMIVGGDRDEIAEGADEEGEGGFEVDAVGCEDEVVSR